jgi:endonuclease YncB( thermonuclease family)
MQPLIFLVVVAVLLIPAAAAGIACGVTVIEGDVDPVEGTAKRIRLCGIDAPEGQETCETAASEQYLCRSNSAQFLANLVGRNSRITCVEGTRDRYGRIVAECGCSSRLNGGAEATGSRRGRPSAMMTVSAGSKAT